MTHRMRCNLRSRRKTLTSVRTSRVTLESTIVQRLENANRRKHRTRSRGVRQPLSCSVEVHCWRLRRCVVLESCPPFSQRAPLRSEPIARGTTQPTTTLGRTSDRSTFVHQDVAFQNPNLVEDRHRSPVCRSSFRRAKFVATYHRSCGQEEPPNAINMRSTCPVQTARTHLGKLAQLCCLFTCAARAAVVQRVHDTGHAKPHRGDAGESADAHSARGSTASRVTNPSTEMPLGKPGPTMVCPAASWLAQRSFKSSKNASGSCRALMR